MLTHLTYRGLQELLACASEDRLDNEVMMYVDGQTFAITAALFTGTIVDDDVLEPDRLYLVID
jgi:hypothetical protein